MSMSFSRLRFCNSKIHVQVEFAEFVCYSGNNGNNGTTCTCTNVHVHVSNNEQNLK